MNESDHYGYLAYTIITREPPALGSLAPRKAEKPTEEESCQ